jgi:uncharacterized protein (DUF2252 family)
MVMQTVIRSGAAVDAVERGRAARGDAPRSSQAWWEPTSDRADPVEILRQQAETRIPALVPIRHGRMLRSPFAFFRGAAAIMAADLAATRTSGLGVQLCGDAHLLNFGGFAAPDRALVFDVNDFDETLPGPWEWDVKRLAASISVACQERGFGTGERRDVVTATVRAYRQAMVDFAAMRTIDVWYARLDITRQVELWGDRLTASRRKGLDKALAKARAKDSLRAFAKLAHEVDGKPRIVSDPPLIVPLEQLALGTDPALMKDALLAMLDDYRQTLQGDRQHLLSGYQPVDLAHKVVGVGSVGTQAWILLLLGHDTSDPLFLQIKEAQASVLEPFAGPSRFATHGQRVVEGQRLMQAASDVFLGWLRVDSGIDGRRHDYYVRQLWDAKVSAAVEVLGASELAAYAEICGWTLARAHARSGDRAAIAAYLGNSDRCDRALTRFAESYAEQNERDYEAFAAAVKTGALRAEAGL